MKGAFKPSGFALSWDMLLLIVLFVAHLWFNPVSNALVVTLVAVYIALGFLFPAMPDEMDAPRLRDRLVFSTRLFIVMFVLFIAAVLPTGWNILQRHVEGPATHAHDGLIQTEAAIQFLLNGKNPYTENYVNTPMANFKGGEPPFTSAPLYHNAYLPFLFLSSIPFYQASQAILGWYDERFFYVLLYIGLLLLLPQLVQKQRDKLILLMAFGLNVLFTYFLADGRNDVVVMFGLVLTTVLLVHRQVAWSAVVLGLMVATKHSAWFFLPFYFVYLLPDPVNLKTIRTTLLKISPLFIVAAIVLVPFLIWDAASFIDDTVSYIVGTSATSFPIKGWGLSTLLLTAGIIPSPESAFPFGILEAGVGLPLLVFLLARQRRENTLQQMWFGFALFSFGVQYVSRFFNDNYLVFILQSLVIASFLTVSRAEKNPEPQAIALPIGES